MAITQKPLQRSIRTPENALVNAPREFAVTRRLPPEARPPAQALLDVKKHLLAALKQLRPAAA